MCTYCLVIKVIIEVGLSHLIIIFKIYFHSSIGTWYEDIYTNMIYIWTEKIHINALGTFLIVLQKITVTISIFGNLWVYKHYLVKYWRVYDYEYTSECIGCCDSIVLKVWPTLLLLTLMSFTIK